MDKLYHQLRLSNTSDNNQYIIFLGDSFSWGQGLYLPNWLDRKPTALSDIVLNHENEDEICVNWTEQEKYIDDIDISLKDKLSFTNIVANKLDRKCLKRIHNGGSITSNVNILNEIVKTGNIYKDVIIIFQFTSIGREEIDGITDEEFKLLNSKNLDIKNILTSRIKKVFDRVDGILSMLEEKYGYRYFYLDWLGDFYNFAPDKFIKIGNSNCFDSLIKDNSIKITYKDKLIWDGHLNEEANKMMANLITDKINLENLK
jgi:hypothetical protein